MSYEFRLLFCVYQVQFIFIENFINLLPRLEYCPIPSNWCKDSGEVKGYEDCDGDKVTRFHSKHHDIHLHENLF